MGCLSNSCYLAIGRERETREERGKRGWKKGGVTRLNVLNVSFKYGRFVNGEVYIQFLFR